jgi:hypothetical protein
VEWIMIHDFNPLHCPPGPPPPFACFLRLGCRPFRFSQRYVIRLCTAMPLMHPIMCMFLPELGEGTMQSDDPAMQPRWLSLVYPVCRPTRRTTFLGAKHYFTVASRLGG